jgi:hypothetical protein
MVKNMNLATLNLLNCVLNDKINQIRNLKKLLSDLKLRMMLLLNHKKILMINLSMLNWLINQNLVVSIMTRIKKEHNVKIMKMKMKNQKFVK